MHYPQTWWPLWPVSCRFCGLLMSDHLVNCSLIIPIRPHLQWGQLHCRAQCSCISCGTPPPKRRGQHATVGYRPRHYNQAAHAVVCRQPPQSHAAPLQQVDKLINLLKRRCVALDFRFCRSGHRRRMSLMKLSRVLAGPPECSSTCEQRTCTTCLSALWWSDAAAAAELKNTKIV